MSDKIDISVLIPIYGVENYIERSMRSIFNQTKTDGVQFVLVNDCTKDSSMDIAVSVMSEYPNLNVKIVNHKENSGIAVARQSCLDVAEGEYVIFFDSDDWCEPTMLEDLYNRAKESDADIVSCDYYLTRTDQEFYCTQQSYNSNIDNLKGVIKGDVYCVLWNKMVRRSLWMGDEMRFPAGLNYGEDLLMCTKLFVKAKKVDYIPKAYLHYIQRGSSISGVMTKKNTDCILDIIKNMELFLENNHLLEEVSNVLIIRKMVTKFLIINNSDGDVYKEYLHVFPEVTKYILGSDISKKYVLYTMWFASKGFPQMLYLLKKIRDRKNRNKEVRKF